MVSYDRKTKKDVFYFYKANWSDETVVYITNSRFAIREKDEIDVKVYSNLENLELFINGESAGKQIGEYATFNWENIKLKKGNNVVLATGQKNGETFSHSVVWMYENNAGLSFLVTFLRWLIKPFVLLLVVWVFWAFWLLLKKRVKRWRKVLTIILLIIAALLLIAIVVGQVMGSKLGINLFEYSLI
jgi:beta-galactosidase